MGRRYYRKRTNPLAVLIVIGVFIIIMFLKYILIATGIVLGLFLLYWITVSIIRLIKYSKSKKFYENTFYFKETNIPYKKIHNKKGQAFEIECFEILRTQIGADFKILTNTIIPRIDSINEFAEIDLMIFHNTGIYVLELKDYTGYVYGGKEDKNWKVGYTDNTKTKQNNEKVYEFYNPIKQNLRHIYDLKKIIDYNYISHIIFSKNMIFNSYINNVTQIEAFIEMIKNKTILSSEELIKIDEVYNTLLKYDLSYDENIKNQHIMRQRLNQINKN